MSGFVGCSTGAPGVDSSAAAVAPLVGRASKVCIERCPRPTHSPPVSAAARSPRTASATSPDAAAVTVCVTNRRRTKEVTKLARTPMDKRRSGLRKRIVVATSSSSAR
ncbi:hypothetical protein LSAT2_001085 [Lamellibrachia satsuma]|nr:hypothetical protein LSAT2_001085 [Lamellibrachia satsuma]